MGNMDGFNAEEQGEMRSFDPLPSGEYEVVVESSEEKESKAGALFLAFVYVVISGAYAGRKLFQNINWKHPTQEVAIMARNELGSLCKAVGKPKPNDTTDLHDIPFFVRVGMRPDKMTGEMGNTIRGYKSKAEGGQQAAAAPAPQPAAGSPQPAAGTVQPRAGASWMRK